jgi:hypothetical protein
MTDIPQIGGNSSHAKKTIVYTTNGTRHEVLTDMMEMLPNGIIVFKSPLGMVLAMFSMGTIESIVPGDIDGRADSGYKRYESPRRKA